MKISEFETQNDFMSFLKDTTFSRDALWTIWYHCEFEEEDIEIEDLDTVWTEMTPGEVASVFNLRERLSFIELNTNEIKNWLEDKTEVYSLSNGYLLFKVFDVKGGR